MFRTPSLNKKLLPRLPAWLVIAVISLTGTTGWAQQIPVWPGDANDDGIVNHLDVLNIGIGFGKQGNPRDTISTGWQQEQVQRWSDTLPNSQNLGLVDCSGNSLVNIEDVAVIDSNYGKTNSNYNGLIFLPGQPTDPGLVIIPNGAAFQQGQLSFVTIYLEQDPADSIYGIAFTFEYDTTVVKKGTVFARPHPQFTGGGSQPISVQRNDTTLAYVEFGIARTNRFNHGGSIAVCNIEFVIEDNLIGKDFLDFANAFRVKKIRMHDKQMHNIPVREDTADAKIATGIREKQPQLFNVYPIPASDRLFVDNYRNKQIVSIEIIDLKGMLHSTTSVQHDWSVMIDVAMLPKGIYVLRMVMKDGVANEKIIIER